MTLSEKIKEDISQALKANEALRVETLRGLMAAIHNREIELRSKEDGPARNASQSEAGGPARNAPLAVAGGLTEEEVIGVLVKEAKKRKEAHQIYTEAGRTDLAEKESKELEIIKNYLPPEMNREEIGAIVKKVTSEGLTDFGRVMGEVMKEVKGRAEAGKVKEIVEKILESSK